MRFGGHAVASRPLEPQILISVAAVDSQKMQENRLRKYFWKIRQIVLTHFRPFPKNALSRHGISQLSFGPG
jgi:hypothetical protein